MNLCIDEAGMGSWAGPLVVAAVMPSPWIEESFEAGSIADSKTLSPKRREILSRQICQKADWWCVRFVSVQTIDRCGLGMARTLAIESIVASQPYDLDGVFIDGIGSKQYAKKVLTTYIIKGDQSMAGIAAASLLAKVARDASMIYYGRQYSQYEFASHKGYGTQKHMSALKRYGVTPLHRTSFAPVKAIQQRTVENRP